MKQRDFGWHVIGRSGRIGFTSRERRGRLISILSPIGSDFFLGIDTQ